MAKQIRIHGDNIIECERALNLIVSAFDGKLTRKSNCLYFPSYFLKTGEKTITEIELFAGHDRWNVSIYKKLAEYGSPIREATDAYVTKTINDTEQILIAIEFCSALPAGNNAWQRNGRAITCSEIGIPYLYFAEVGGIELDNNRNIKAPRFPNPIVPFSYISVSSSLDIICIPIYQAHPAITEELRTKFINSFGLEESLKLIKCLLEETDPSAPLKTLIEKGTVLVKILSNERKRIDTLRETQWDTFLTLKSGLQKAKWILTNANDLIWQRKQSEKVNVTKTYKRLIKKVQKLNCLSIGAKDIPICLIPEDKLSNLKEIFKVIYPLQEELQKILSAIHDPIIIVWITGFKPRGDDSRPDRGLVPLARMLFGNDIEILTIVSGPAKKATWEMLKNNPGKLAEINGLWEAILNLSNYVFIDSITSENGEIFHSIERKLERRIAPVTFSKATTDIEYSEHDTDTAIHTIFSKQESYNVFEAMCNPPGGDWSGISVVDLDKKQEFRWTSLPRVSDINGKRPDHVIQIIKDHKIIFLAIESKNRANDLEDKIGVRLINYVNELFSGAPTACKPKVKEWQIFEGDKSPLENYTTYSGGAFCFHNDQEIINEIKKGELDFILAFDFKPITEASTLHLKVSEQCNFLIDLITELTKQLGTGLIINVH